MTKRKTRQTEIPHPDELDRYIDGMYRDQLLELLRCKDSLLVRDHHALRELGKGGWIDFNYPERNQWFDRTQVQLLMLLRRSTKLKSRHHAILDVIKYANKEE